MPPFVPRKRARSPSPERSAPKAPNGTKNKKKQTVTVFEAAEALEKSKSKHTMEENASHLEKLPDDESLSSEVDSDDFEDAMPASEHNDSGSEEEMDWEDAVHNNNEPTISGDLELTLDSIDNHSHGSLTNPLGAKKGPSKIEKAIRTSAHCMHVQCLMYFNYVRNQWLNDSKVQKTLVDTLMLNSGMKQEVERWRKACAEARSDSNDVPHESPAKKDKGKGKATTAPKAKDKSSTKKAKQQRDWGIDANVDGVPTLAHGDPTVRLLKALTAYWRKKFTITVPGLRKYGWKDAARLQAEVKSLREDPHDPEAHGERVRGVEELRFLAKKCEGSRDLGAQLFTALLRGLGAEARMVASLQPVGFSFTKNEEAAPARKRVVKDKVSETSSSKPTKHDSDLEILEGPPPKKRKLAVGSKAKTGSSRESAIDVAEDSEVRTPADTNLDSDDASIVDITPPTPSKVTHRYDRDLVFPIYWTEVLSSTALTWIPTDPLVLNVVATKEEDIEKFEARGAQADKAKQVTAYIIGFASDGSAKDITTRYLKKHIWPGKTKGVRIATERVLMSHRRSKAKRYTEYDWFRTVMRPYQRPEQRTTKADRIEDARELVPAKPAKKDKKQGEETLADYKASEEFVLERFLRREEALLPNAEQVKTFKSGKGDKEKEEAVYLRDDVVSCKTVESWHKEGREVKAGEQPLKWVPIRAVTTIRKQEIEAAERESGEKQKQGLYSKAQTEWIIPDPIVDGRIPKNSFGNMDVYVPTMVPAGAVHVAIRGTAKICKKLGIDFAEACVGFEFGNRRAVPILTGVVVAKENKSLLVDAWKADEAVKRQKESDKREKLALGMWKKFTAALRIIKRVREEYGPDQAESHFAEALSGLAKKGKKNEGKESGKRKIKAGIDDDDEEVSGLGGTSVYGSTSNGGGGFIVDDDSTHQAGGFSVGEDADAGNESSIFATSARHSHTPISLQSAHRLDQDDLVQVSSAHFKSTSGQGAETENGRGKGKGKAAVSKSVKATMPAKRKSLLSAESDVNMDDAITSHDAAYDGDSPTRSMSAKKITNGTAQPPARRSTRPAAKSASEAVRSRYFEVDSADEDELSDE